MAEAVYVLCAVTSLVCAILLYRGYRASRTKLLFWSCLCFTGLALNSVLVVVDLLVMPDVDLSTIRTAPAVGGMMLLLVGLVWESA